MRGLLIGMALLGSSVALDHAECLRHGQKHRTLDPWLRELGYNEKEVIQKGVIAIDAATWSPPCPS